MRMFDMANDSGLFRTRERARGGRLDARRQRLPRGTSAYLPLYEAKMVHHFDHRFGTYEGQTDAQANQGKLPTRRREHADPTTVTLPRYWVPEAEVDARLKDGGTGDWLLGWRDICRNTDERTVIASVVPARRRRA